MKLVLIGLGIFFIAFSALAGTFLDTFDDGKNSSIGSHW